MIFDLDGTLIDSEPNYREVDSRYLLSKGILLSDDEWENVVGMGGDPFIDFLRSRFGLEGDTDALIAEKDDLYLEFAQGRTRAFPRSVELVRYLHLHGYPLGVGTSSRTRVLRRMLDEAKLSRYFSATVGSDEVEHPKPAPDIFLRVARRLGVAPEHCLVIEDSQYGVRAATGASMMVVAVPAAPQADRPAFDEAALVYAGGPEKLDVHEVITRFGLTGDHPDDRLGPGSARVERFRAIVREHHAHTARAMPWRETDDPYAIMVSEFMLQQTQVARVVPKYHEFLSRFPRVEDLASASLQDVLELWQGLGYNRRGKNLRDAARQIVERYGACVPESVEELRSLPGVGSYTAAAIAGFAYGEPVTMIETNIRRVFIHYFFPGQERVHDRDLEPLIRATIPASGVREWYYALMDYGADLTRLVTNANRRSRHYARQSAFSGSVREVRGKIVRALTRHGSLSIEELERLAGPTDERFMPAVEGLARDGLVTNEAGRVTLR